MDDDELEIDFGGLCLSARDGDIKVFKVWTDTAHNSYERALVIFLKHTGLANKAVVFCDSARNASAFVRHADDLGLCINNTVVWQNSAQFRGATFQAGAVFVMEKPARYLPDAAHVDFLDAAASSTDSELHILDPRPFDESIRDCVALLEKETALLNQGVLPGE